MKYSFRCSTCNLSFEEKHSPLRLEALKESGVECQCGGRADYYFDPKGIQVSFTGDSWADKNYKEKAYRANRSSQMQARQNRHVFKPRLAPNYKGERTSSWKEARNEAAADGKDTRVYDQFVTKENDNS